ncbi:hypothetical protein [Consotaella salsifontis]|uniref:Uncharacterized protein n=1 Tax=Consotaella salsifontis TaxID=1365950 RepID=A0A1T4RVP2_9HYPH|nr:hypothetical protein [Consotaella salsifontis]SKA20022.1 hypothetical protein SAMN05428963_10814 [Consotaella salsifontis]
MADRSGYSDAHRERERAATRERMARRYAAMTPDERAAIARRRKEREREKASKDPEWAAAHRARRRRTLARYFNSRRDDPDFLIARTEYLRMWREGRRESEHFDQFMARIEAGGE